MKTIKDKIGSYKNANNKKIEITQMKEDILQLKYEDGSTEDIQRNLELSVLQNK